MIFASLSAESTNCFTPCGSQIAGVGAGRTLSKEDAHADALRTRFLQRLNFAQAHDRREFAAVHGNGFGGRGAALHGALYNVSGNFLQIG